MPSEMSQGFNASMKVMSAAISLPSQMSPQQPLTLPLTRVPLCYWHGGIAFTGCLDAKALLAVVPFSLLFSLEVSCFMS